MKSKGTVRQDRAMNTNDNGRAETRSRANGRLRRMTIGTAVLGVLATGSFGGLAALTYDGSSDSGSAVAEVDTSTTTITTTTTATSAATAEPTATAAAAAAATAAPAVTTTQGAAHATTGGS
jgi:hypothetical protein